MELGATKPAKGIKLHLHTDSASRKAMHGQQAWNVKEIQAHRTQISSSSRLGGVRSHHSAQDWHSEQPIRHLHQINATTKTH
eukprot:2915624-Amphidinium_carterae.3